MIKKSTTGKRVQIYLHARHVAWWQALPRYDRSRIVAAALDLWREKAAEQLTPPAQRS